MKIFTLSLLAILSITCTSSYAKQKPDSKDIIGLWSIIEVRLTEIEDETKSICYTSKDISCEESVELVNNQFSKVTLDFKADGHLIIKNSPAPKDPTTLDAAYKIIDRETEIFVDIAGSQAFSGEPYLVRLISKDKIQLVYSDKKRNMKMIFTLKSIQK